MSAASDLIERMERETGQRVDANDGNNNAMASLFGALARAMGKSNHQPKDDMVAGLLLVHQQSPEYQNEQRSKAIIASLFSQGMSPDDVRAILGGK